MERWIQAQGVPEMPLEDDQAMEMPMPVKMAIGKEEVLKAQETLQTYKRGKANLERRIVSNEQWFKLQHWREIGKSSNPGDPEPTSAWLLNCIMNKHADAMDNYPAPSVLPREAGDEAAAAQLSSILPVVLEQNAYDQTYNDTWWYKLKTGTGVTGVFWSSGKQNGLGDIDIRKIDLLNLFWEPGITDIQRSRNIFHVELWDNDLLKARYPEAARDIGQSSMDVTKYRYDDTVDTSQKSAVVDWYYKKTAGTREVLHYVKFCGSAVLFASENEPDYQERGFYDHGRYPFVLDRLFPEEGTPAGFGYIDVCKSPQLYIDKLDQVILKNAVMSARQRYFVRGDGTVNEAEFADWEKEFVHVPAGNPRDNIMPIEVAKLPDVCVVIRNNKIEELKETSGNRDFSQGGTAQGVTAASAIAALQEAGSKTSRDMIKSSYRAFAEINTLSIELIRQFYDEPRCFRIIGEQGQQQFTEFSNQQIRQVEQGNDFGLMLGARAPVFDIKVASQKSSPFSTVAQNERAKELYGMGFFNPQLSDQALAALDMMDFEGIEKVRQRIQQNGTLMQMVQQMQQQVMQLAQIVDAQNGTSILQGMAGAGAGPGAEQGGPAMEQPGGGQGEVATNSLGKAIGAGQQGTAAKARVRAADASKPR